MIITFHWLKVLKWFKNWIYIWNRVLFDELLLRSRRQIKVIERSMATVLEKPSFFVQKSLYISNYSSSRNFFRFSFAKIYLILSKTSSSQICLDNRLSFSLCCIKTLSKRCQNTLKWSKWCQNDVKIIFLWFWFVHFYISPRTH